ncbi:MAG TPA: DUF2911 domain-containing protein [Blastocatellia bacterium]|nr:DUF2911 domain-containing protein [Blastocatellia bacterium]
MQKRIIILSVCLIALAIGAIAAISQQQQASPRGSAEVTVNGKKVSIDYGRPSMRGRKVYGGLVPYGQVWRTGANKATHLTTEADLMIGNLTVPKGTYTLFTIPSENGWKLIINKHTGQWGIPYKPEYEQEELGRVDMKVAKLNSPVEQFTISLNQADGGGTMKMEWENTSASVDFKVK